VYRLLCGRRKGNIQLLGGAWNQELDGGDPLVDRSCLLQTLRRTVLAQSMFDVSTAGKIIKVCELLYHRPEEELNGKTFPEMVRYRAK
jgi:hypothetical protein